MLSGFFIGRGVAFIVGMQVVAFVAFEGPEIDAGEHNDDILSELGFSASEVSELRSQRVI